MVFQHWRYKGKWWLVAAFHSSSSLRPLARRFIAAFSLCSVFAFLSRNSRRGQQISFQNNDFHHSVLAVQSSNSSIESNTMTLPGSPGTAVSHNIVFIDTSLDTHLAMAVSDGDTVSDVKEKIEKEHPLCFSHLGNIKIHALKVQRKGHLYHLSDSMYLKSAFFGVDDSWFLSIDASVADGHSTDPNTGNLSTYFRRADNTSVDESILARNNHHGRIPNHEAPSLPDYAVQQHVNEKTPTDVYFGSCHSSKKDLMIKKAEVTHSVENCSKDLPRRTMNNCEGFNRTLETLLPVKVNRKSKKRKTKLVNEHEVVNHTSDDNDQNPLQQVVGFCEKNVELGHVQSIRDVCDEAALGVKRITDSNDLAFKSNDPTDLQKSICTSEDANNVQSNQLTCKTGQIEAIPEEKDSMQNTDTKATMVENCRSSIRDGTDTNVKAPHISELVHLKGAAENTKRSKKKKTKKSKDLAEGRQINLVTTGARDSAYDIPPTELHSINLGDNPSSKAETVESNVSLMKVENTTSASILTTVRNIDIDRPNISRVELAQQINKAEEENVDGQVRKKIKKRSATSVKSTLQAENIGNEDSMLSLHSITLGDNSSSKAEMVENNVSLMKGEKKTSASILPTVRNIDIDGENISKVEPSQKTSKTEAGSENVDKQVRKKIKKRPATSVKSTSYLQAENIGNEDSLLSKRSNGEVKSESIAVKETKLPRNEIEETKLESTLFSEVESSPPSICKSRIVGSSQSRSQVSEGNHEGRSLEANICSNAAKDGTGNNVDNRAEVPSESDKVGIEESAGRLQDESIKFNGEKLSREKSANTLLKAKRKKEDPNACSSGASLSMQNIQKSDENTETGRQCQTSNSSSLKFDGSPSRDICDVKLHFDNKVEKKSRGGVKSLSSNERKQQMCNSNKAATVKPNTVNSSRDSTEKNSETSAVPRTRSSLKNSAHMVYQDQKHMGHQSGHPVGRRKSSHNGNKDATQSERRNLLATSGAIFKDASSDSSEDEGGIADSDVSTRSPDDSLSSDFSDGESNGSVDFIERENIRRRSTRKKDSSPDDMALDAILRSSSRYKKAKLTAAQLQQDDTESQPVDFVPDSQANI